MNDQLKGTLLTVAGVIVLSPDAMIIRLMSVDAMTVVFWRGMGIFVVFTAMSLIRHRGRVVAYARRCGWTGLVIALCLAVCQLAFVGGVAITNPSHVLVMVAATPLCAAIASRILLGERIAPSTAIAIAAGLGGVAIMLSAHATGGGSWRGDLVAAVVPISLGTAFTLIRKLRADDVWFLYSMAGLMVMLAAWPFHAPGLLPGSDAALMGLLVFVVVPVSFALVTQGPRYITAAEVSLIMLLETILGPVWVWAVVGIAPTVHALVGGGVLIATLAIHAWWRIGRTRGQKSEAIPLTSQSP